ncbi:hypothetical protein BKH17_12160 [Actinomyces oris]|uniref:hypothetical protein n=1 Tax=Actinomyces oris TaxID=544580 RepID=UPI00094A0490|nr:hypothetical protein [Actinomyces oris]OLL11222.1 hypothetical protein BKH17_12160 [Actinomyces oris]
MTSVGWLGLPPVAWSLISVGSSIVGLWLLGLAARRVRGWLRVGVRLLAAGLQFSLVLCGLSVLAVHMSPRAQAMAIFAAALGAAVWRFYVLPSVSVPQVPGTSDLGAASPAGKEALA